MAHFQSVTSVQGTSFNSLHILEEYEVHAPWKYIRATLLDCASLLLWKIQQFFEGLTMPAANKSIGPGMFNVQKLVFYHM
jgi:hypothetical protein